MTTIYKDFQIRWVMNKATWTYLEGALLLDEKNPEDFRDFKPDIRGSERVNVLYYWLVKQHQIGELHAYPEDKELSTTPGNIMREVHAHRQNYSKDFYKLWEAVRYGTNNDRILSKLQWSTYLWAINLIKIYYPEATKTSIAKALNKLPSHFQFPTGQRLMPYSVTTLGDHCITRA